MMSLSEAAAAIGARAVGSEIRFDGVSTDTRSVGKGELFVAIRGDRFDGHEFLAAARSVVRRPRWSTENMPAARLCRYWLPTTRGVRSGAWAGTGGCASRRS